MEITGSMKVLKWEEQEVQHGSSIGRITYEFTSEITFKGHGSYVFNYLHLSKEEPLQSISIYKGFITLDILINNKNEQITLLDEGKFENGIANSQLKIIKSNNFSGHGNYQASHNQSNFTLTIGPS